MCEMFEYKINQNNKYSSNKVKVKGFFFERLKDLKNKRPKQLL